MGLRNQIGWVLLAVTVYVTPLFAQASLCGILVASATGYFHPRQSPHHDLAQAAGFSTFGGLSAFVNESGAMKNHSDCRPGEYARCLSNELSADPQLARALAPQCLIDRGAIHAVDQIPWDTILSVGFYFAPGTRRDEFRVMGRSSVRGDETVQGNVEALLRAYRARARILEGQIKVTIDRVVQPVAHLSDFYFEATVTIEAP